MSDTSIFVNRLRGALAVVCGFVLAAIIPIGASSAAEKNVDLDAKAGNGNESNVKLTIVSTYPAKVKNKVTNRAVGEAFTFAWKSAGPGGFSSSAGNATSPGNANGVGAVWDWETMQSIYAFTGRLCADDICFTKTFPAPPQGSAPVTRGPFEVPGRSLTANGVTPTSESLTSTLITFFSPEVTLVRVTSRVEQLATGEFRYTTRIENLTDDPIVFDLAPGPLGCSQSCPEGETLCEQCVDTDTDSANCGGCGNECAEGDICSGGECTSGLTCDEPQVPCGDSCVDLSSDVLNCGTCGNDCTDDECPYGEYCSSGSCYCSPGLAAPATTDGAPDCAFQGFHGITIPAGGVFEDCHVDAHLPKEITSQLTVCGNDIPDGDPACSNGDPASQGPVNLFIDNPDLLPGNVLITPVDVLVTHEDSGDGFIQPGETASLKIFVRNAGALNITGVNGLLSSPPVDLTDDGASNPESVTMLSDNSPYPNLAGTGAAGGGNCNSLPAVQHAEANVISYVMRFPPEHTLEVARPANLHITGQTGATAAAVSFDMPFNIGIGGACDPGDADGAFDALDGLSAPMAGLVLEGNTPPKPKSAFRQGKTRPLKLRMSCGGVDLTEANSAAPEIVALSRDGVAIDVSTIDLNDNANSDSLFFRHSGSEGQWIYNMRTKDLPAGDYLITIRLPNGNNYVGAFSLTHTGKLDVSRQSGIPKSTPTQ